MEQVLGNVNRLNRNLESIIAVRSPSPSTSSVYKWWMIHGLIKKQVGNEFGSVEALWSQFEHFMGRPDAQGVAEGGPEGQDEHQHAQGQDHGQDIKQEEPEEGESTIMKWLTMIF